MNYHRLKVGRLPVSITGLAETPGMPLKYPNISVVAFVSTGFLVQTGELILARALTPCRHCRDGLHRICEAPIPIPTILAYLRGAKNLPTVTLACCDRKEFWTQPVYT